MTPRESRSLEPLLDAPPFLDEPARTSPERRPVAIEVERLTKKFGGQTADDAISFTVSAGETYGILGPNGAGKTTLIRMLTTLLHPTSGTARIRGRDIVQEQPAVRALIGTVSQAVTTDENLTVDENLSIQGKMYGLFGRGLKRMIDRRVEQVGLTERRHQVTRELSGGMRRRLEIARGVLHSPHVLFLDEPTTGLDPQSRRSIWEMLGELKSVDAELAIILTTHAMDEADALCDRVAIVDQGRILCEDSPAALKRSLETGERTQIETDRDLAPADREALAQMGGKNWRAVTPSVFEFQSRPGEGIGRRAAQQLEERGYRVLQLTIAPVTLEDVFFSYTGRGLRGE